MSYTIKFLFFQKEINIIFFFNKQYLIINQKKIFFHFKKKIIIIIYLIINQKIKIKTKHCFQNQQEQIIIPLTPNTNQYRMIRKISTNTDCKSQSEFQTVDSPGLTHTDHSEQSDRKKYNIISEDLRKQIIKRLTVDKKSIKEVSKEFNLKLSTCKAILQVYLKEGRIGKKTTRDRKSKIVNTLVIATINPVNPLQSTLTPFVQVSEYKSSHKGSEDNDFQDKLVAESIQKAASHISGVFDQSSNNDPNIQNVTIPQESLNMLQNTFMQTQMQTFNQFLLNQSNNFQFAQQISQLSGQDMFQNAMKNFGQSQGKNMNPVQQNSSAHKSEEGEDDEDIDNEILETIQKKIFCDNKKIIRKNSIIVQKQGENN